MKFADLVTASDELPNTASCFWGNPRGQYLAQTKYRWHRLPIRRDTVKYRMRTDIVNIVCPLGMRPIGSK